MKKNDAHWFAVQVSDTEFSGMTKEQMVVNKNFNKKY
jgi:hypothetical protein